FAHRVLGRHGHGLTCALHQQGVRLVHSVLIAALCAGALLAPPESSRLVVLIGDAGAPKPAQAPNTVATVSGAEAFERLGLGGPTPPPVPDSAPALTDFEAGARAYWDEGRIKVAIARLEAGRRQVSGRVKRSQRTQVVKGLWLLAQIQIQKKRAEEARVVLELAVAIAPQARPSLKQVSPRLLKAWEGVFTAYAASAATITIAARRLPVDCVALVDGLERGVPGQALGPFPHGPHSVSVRCAKGASPQHPVMIGSATVVDVAGWELGLVSGKSLRVADSAAGEGLAEELLRRRIASEVVLVTVGSAGRVRVNVLGPGVPAQGSAPRGSETLVEPDSISSQDRRAAWWHWVMLGVGVAATGAASGVHAHALGLRSDTNQGSIDNRSSTSGLEPAYLGLYATGGSLAISGLILALIGE
ncbi:MAG: hypothetical protein ACI9WU_004744, partial [Myxococcota bacterium]